MPFIVIGTATYQEELKNWPKVDRDAAEKLPQKLSENPFVGRQLTYPFLREKKIGGKRIYYLIYDDLQLVLLVAVSEKKDQQATIDHIKDSLDEFRRVAREVIRRAA